MIPYYVHTCRDPRHWLLVLVGLLLLLLLWLHLDPDEGALHDRHADLLDRLARGGRNLAQHDPAHALLGGRQLQWRLLIGLTFVREEVNPKSNPTL